MSCLARKALYSYAGGITSYYVEYIDLIFLRLYHFGIHVSVNAIMQYGSILFLYCFKPLLCFG